VSSSAAPDYLAGADSQLPERGERVVVAMSGGVDSSLVAALLHARGCEVIGVTLSLYEVASDTVGGCCSPEDISDARRVCGDLGVPHYVLNYRERFHELVVQPFVDSYRSGETPNPCVACNTFLKFDQLLGMTAKLQAKWLATGHYARISGGSDGRLRLRAGVDDGKDQSYFLWGIRSEVLSSLTFPLGTMTKEQVRDAARRLSVRTSGKPDSQDVCFIPSGRTAEFVASTGGGAGEGDVVDAQGQVLGRHGGVHAFTIGQRRGLGIASPDPLYVTALDAKRKLVVVGSADALQTRTVLARDWNWLRRPEPGEELSARVRYRSRATAVGSYQPAGDGLRLEFDDAVSAVAPGQSLVLYGGSAGGEVLGGGTITADRTP
jgi:tRNA-specific 2-thiouridylase